MAEAGELLRLSEAKGKVFMISQNRRWDTRNVQLRRTLEENLGTVGMLNCAFYLGAHFGGFWDEMTNPLLLDMAIHHLDLARFFTRQDPVPVYAAAFNPKARGMRGTRRRAASSS